MIEPVRTDLNCHACGHNFIAQLDMGLDGQHVVLCPYCLHQHCRTIENGVVTGDRWDSRAVTHEVPTDSVWKCDSLPIVTSTAAAFVRDAWLNRFDLAL